MSVPVLPVKVPAVLTSPLGPSLILPVEVTLILPGMLFSGLSFTTPFKMMS